MSIPVWVAVGIGAVVLIGVIVLLTRLRSTRQPPDAVVSAKASYDAVLAKGHRTHERATKLARDVQSDWERVAVARLDARVRAMGHDR